MAFTLWQVSHSETYLAISLFILVHQKFCFRPWYILLLPGWIENLERCASSRICFRSSWFFGTTMWLSNHRTPLWSWQKHLYFLSPWESFCLMIPTTLSCDCAMMIWSWRVGSTEIWFKVPWGSSLDWASSSHGIVFRYRIPRIGNGNELCGLVHPLLHSPCLGDSAPQDHNLWLILAIFFASYLGRLE